MVHAQTPDFVFRRNGRVHLNQWGRQFSRILAAEACASAVVILDTPCSEVVWRVATHSIHQFPFHFPSRASQCTITFQLESTGALMSDLTCNWASRNNFWLWPFFLRAEDTIYTDERASLNKHTNMCMGMYLLKRGQYKNNSLGTVVNMLSWLLLLLFKVMTTIKTNYDD